MSKSHGEKTVITLTDEPNAIADKIKRAVTETTGMVTMTQEEIEHHMNTDRALHGDDVQFKGMVGVWNLLTLLRAFGSPAEVDAVLESQPIKYGELKKLVAKRTAEYFAPFREKRAALAKDPKKVAAILEDGAKKARAIAAATMAEVRTRIGIR